MKLIKANYLCDFCYAHGAKARRDVKNYHLTAVNKELVEALQRMIERPGVPPLETDIKFAKQAIAKAEAI